jgi:hypothetical protein
MTTSAFSGVGGGLAHKISITLPLFIEVLLPSQERGQLYTCVRGIDFVSTILIFDTCSMCSLFILFYLFFSIIWKDPRQTDIQIHFLWRGIRDDWIFKTHIYTLQSLLQTIVLILIYLFVNIVVKCKVTKTFEHEKLTCWTGVRQITKEGDSMCIKNVAIGQLWNTNMNIVFETFMTIRLYVNTL